MRSSLALVVGCALASGCLLEWDRLRATDGGRPMPDTAVEDTGVPEDTEPPPDTRVPPEDTAVVDSGVDSRVDMGPELAPPDTTVPDTMVPVDTMIPADTRVPDTAMPDTAMDSRVDTSAPDTTPMDTFVPVDTAPADTGPPDAGDCFRGLCRCSAMNPTGWCMVGEGCSSGACVRLPGGVVGALVVTEVMSDPNYPAGGNASAPEWFEVYNPGPTPVNLQGMRVSDNSGSYSVPAALILPARAYAVFAYTLDPALNTGLRNITVVYGSAILLANGADRVVLDMGTPTTEIDRVEYASTGWPNMRGRSKTLNPTSLNAMDNNTGSNWCNGARMYGTEMNMGTPGEANTCP
ncbi:MAG: lamin tail domain-containing protein [Deltaproteobacteria bacterium]|nr:lamin tail domain-containing protein [Deltaproteobacteria bacterium]